MEKRQFKALFVARLNMEKKHDAIYDSITWILYSETKTVKVYHFKF